VLAARSGPPYVADTETYAAHTLAGVILSGETSEIDTTTL
jgi:hypothetical protein